MGTTTKVDKKEHHDEQRNDEPQNGKLQRDVDARQVVLHTTDLMGRCILSFLEWQDVMACRAVCRSWWRDVVPHTPVEMWKIATPATAWMIRAAALCMPQLQALRATHAAALTDDLLTTILQCFCHLRRLELPEAGASLQTSLLGTTTILLPRTLTYVNLHNHTQLQWNLKTTLVQALPCLQDLRVVNNYAATGELRDLLPVARQLRVLDVSGCRGITGNILDCRDFDVLEWLGLNRTSVRGDVRDICPGHFPALQWLGLDPDTMYGASTIDRVAHAEAVMRGRHVIARQSNNPTPIFPLLVRLDESSPDYHARIEQRLYTSDRDPPFAIQPVVLAGGKRRGWRWSNLLGGCCEVHWLDPEVSDSDIDDDYQREWLELRQETQQSLFAGFWDPPTPAQYEQLCREKC